MITKQGRKKSVSKATTVRRTFMLSKPQIPLQELPPPMACPFCGSRDIDVDIEERQRDAEHTYHTAAARCVGCGCEAPQVTTNFPNVGSFTEYEIIMEAARKWNRRRDLYAEPPAKEVA